MSLLPRLALAAGVLVLAACATSTPPRVIAGVTVAPPPAPQPVVDTFFGTRVDDPYRFLESVKYPAVAAWMKGQADATRAILDTIPGRAALLARLTEIDAAAAGSISALRRTEGGRLFFTRREPGENQFKLVLRQPDGAERVLVDAEARGKAAGKVLALLDWAPAHDGRHVAYVLQVGGSEIGELHLMEVASGQDIVAPIDRIRFGSVSWLRDGSGFFFARLREGYEQLPGTEKFGDRAIHFFSLPTRQSRPVFSALRNPELELPLFASGFISEVPGSGQALLGVGLGVDRNRMAYVGDLKAATEGRAQWRKLVDASDEVREITVAGGWVYLLSARGAPRHRVLRMPLAAADLARAEEVVPASEEVVVSVAAARDALYVIKRRGAAMQLARLPHDAPHDAQTVALPFEGTVSVLDSDSQRDGVSLAVVGWTRATQRFEVRVPTPGQAVTLVPLTLAQAGSFDAPPQMVAREAMVPSQDGTLVPVSIIHHRDLQRDGRNPTVLYGYGAYGITENPFFNPRLLAWIERGGVYVFAHVRGGGMLGTEWHRAGQKATKPNTWRDGIAVADWLVDNGYTSPQRLGIFGGSAGGIFVGRAITERPDLFAAAVSGVGVKDTVRAELDPNGMANVPEFGTVNDEAGFRALRAMSSYHHVRDGVRYPGTLLVHGVNDIRVSVWQSSKFAARLAQASTGGPVLMRLDYELGHGGGATRAQSQAQNADVWSFMLWQMGVPQFQPRL